MKTPVLVTLAVTTLAFAGMIVYLVATDRDPLLMVTALITIIPVLGTLFLGQKTVNQTNGTLSAYRVENAGLRVENSQLRNYVPTDVATNIPVTPPVPSDVAVTATEPV
jgi:hypothetical protein